ncbi:MULTISPECIES: L-serine ammonia-lyase, iron-sulfur-dependent subunit beta [Peptoniphilus]|uniref:L-serine ammonia-lyase, iron-sulfur-dependent subunit beta n=1 Tax=Peptoniphilus TaxID=162289 RepID=UPI002355043F|nr:MULTISPECIES: L-serine ammonia-lyase, iron-sulfur-dependent subunit beta [Peptoniphilus]MBS6610478.1 L-serine ammonia-lyase, iron-sulfur-dependent subunit beta [Peptoniphilus harei]MDU1954865.1 L-serine ammonia-lyase, iron-sulfur-dependent subunit beta [Peptoniphilus lacydonensis]MDU2114764.1 L-serine ammonia-lyase, iron-sulfur-dependent subunit beta [Peptoniphilus lacydonensis]MDU3750507.1 L-serine ammonia-lyase, iron-sulfur-dependent subunit beta [Peptoniphilus rhinitidis]MDU5274328.1 L-s
MKEYTSFEILGPIMVGPSSSHTAGACKIGRVAAKICPKNYESVDFYLHGSFAYTYKGHGTDKALLGGIMGFETFDDSIRDAYKIADARGINYKFIPTNLGEDYHPNTVKVVFNYKDGTSEYVIGSSIGGGNIIIVEINGIKVNFDGRFPTFLFQYPEQTGVIAEVSTVLAEEDYNIESINTAKDELKNIVTLTVELDEKASESVKNKLLDNSRYIESKYVEV